MNFVFEMRSAVVFKNFRIEILDAETKAGHAEFAQRFELVLLQRAGFALERHFLGAFPLQSRLEAFHQAASWLALRYDGVPPPK